MHRNFVTSCAILLWQSEIHFESRHNDRNGAKEPKDTPKTLSAMNARAQLSHTSAKCVVHSESKMYAMILCSYAQFDLFFFFSSRSFFPFLFRCCRVVQAERARDTTRTHWQPLLSTRYSLSNSRLPPSTRPVSCTRNDFFLFSFIARLPVSSAAAAAASANRKTSAHIRDIRIRVWWLCECANISVCARWTHTVWISNAHGRGKSRARPLLACTTRTVTNKKRRKKKWKIKKKREWTNDRTRQRRRRRRWSETIWTTKKGKDEKSEIIFQLIVD